MTDVNAELLKPLDGDPIGTVRQFNKADFEVLKGLGAVKMTDAPLNKMDPAPENKADPAAAAAAEAAAAEAGAGAGKKKG